MNGHVPDLPPPWNIAAEGGLEIRGPLGSVEFREGGMQAEDAEQSRWCPWHEAYEMSADVPVLTLRMRRAQALLCSLSPSADVESPDIWVSLNSRQRWVFELGRGDDAPYSRASRDLVRRVFSTLSELHPRNGRWENSLRILGHPAAGPDLVAEMYGARLQRRGVRDRRFDRVAARVTERHGLDGFGRPQF